MGREKREAAPPHTSGFRTSLEKIPGSDPEGVGGAVLAHSRNAPDNCGIARIGRFIVGVLKAEPDGCVHIVHNVADDLLGVDHGVRVGGAFFQAWLTFERV